MIPEEFDCKTDCPIPGACCQGFAVNIKTELSDAEITESLVSRYNLGQMKLIGRTKNYNAPILVCSWLDMETGLCTDYENRPQLCRDFTPLSNPLCAAFCGPGGCDMKQRVQDYHSQERQP